MDVQHRNAVTSCSGVTNNPIGNINLVQKSNAKSESVPQKELRIRVRIQSDSLPDKIKIFRIKRKMCFID